MQKLYDLIYQIARGVKGRFGYAISIKHAILAAYFAFIVGVFVELTSLVQMAYLAMSGAFPVAGGLAVAVFPDATVISGGTTLYLSVLTFKKIARYSSSMWGAWVSASKA